MYSITFYPQMIFAGIALMDYHWVLLLGTSNYVSQWGSNETPFASRQTLQYTPMKYFFEAMLAMNEYKTKICCGSLYLDAKSPSIYAH